MHAELKQSWIQALRSGKYNQGRGHLRAELYGKTYHCAMGVLYDLIATPEQWERLRLGESSHFYGAYLPIETYEQTNIDPRFEKRIASLNDEGATFHEIADIMERDLLSEPDVADYVEAELSRIAALPPPYKVSQFSTSFGLWASENERINHGMIWSYA